MKVYALFGVLGTAMPELTSLSESERDRALERFRMLQPHLEQGRPLRQVALEAGIPYRTAQRWLASYRRFGLGALARKARQDRGSRRHLSPKLREVVEGLALQKPPVPITALYRQVREIALTHGERVPSYRVVYDVVQRLPADLVTLAHEGAKAYGDAFELVHRREADRSNAVWQADHTLLDIELINPGAAGAPGVAKPWLTVVLDDYSRAVAGFYLSFEAPCALNTALALRQAIWRKADVAWTVCGIPEVLYTDNGRDFTSRHLEQVAADLKIRLVFSTPGLPRGRGRIERFFSSVDQMFLCELPGYARSGGQARLTLAELEGRFQHFITGVYHLRAHRETKVPPAQRWEAGGFLPRMPESLEQLDLLLIMVPKARKVHPDGIRLNGLRYVDTTLAAYIGESVTLRYDPRDAAEVRVFHRERFLCRAVCPELAGMTVPLREVLKARRQRRRALRQTLRERRKAVDELLGLKRAGQKEEEPPPEPAPEGPEVPGAPALKRYRNE